MAAGALDDRRPASRATLLAAIVAAHLVALWLLLQPGRARLADDRQPVLAVFDLAPEPPPPPPLPPPTPRLTRAETRTSSGGGSPGRRRERPARMIEMPAPPRREAMDATLAATPLPSAMAAGGSASIDLGLGGAGGDGSGSGSGNGPGDGDGAGAADTYARAQWVSVAKPDVWRRNWPAGRGKLAQTVTVMLRCKVRRSGRPYACRVRSESQRLGFAATALAIVDESRVRPVARNGDPLWDVPVLISIVFDAIETAPRIPLTAAASGPRAR